MTPTEYSPESTRPAGTSLLAIGSLFLGVLGCALPLLSSIPAIVCGHSALTRIRKSGGALGGKGLAITGLVLGYAATAIFLFVLGWGALAATEKAKKTKARHICSTMDTAILTFLDEYGCLPLPRGTEKSPGHDIEILTDSPQGVQLLTALMGLEKGSPGDMLNPKNIRFLDIPEGKRTKDGGRDGIIYNPDGSIRGIYDPWKRPYRILLDADYDDSLDNNPFSTGDKSLPGRSVGTFTFGKDGKNDSGAGDDVKSW